MLQINAMFGATKLHQVLCNCLSIWFSCHEGPVKTGVKTVVSVVYWDQQLGTMHHNAGKIRNVYTLVVC